eukprot:454592_1
MLFNLILFYLVAGSDGYHLVSLASNYSDATLQCLHMNSTLATIISPLANWQARLTCQKSILSSPIKDSYRCFIGLNNQKTKNEFVWMDGSTSEFRDWVATRQTTNETLTNHSCVVITSSGWHSHSCADKLPALCNEGSYLTPETTNRNVNRDPYTPTTFIFSTVLIHATDDFMTTITDSEESNNFTLNQLYFVSLTFMVQIFFLIICCESGILGVRTFKRVRLEGLKCQAVINRKYTTTSTSKESHPLDGSTSTITTTHYHFDIQFVIMKNTNLYDAEPCFLICQASLEYLEESYYERFNNNDVICLRYLLDKNQSKFQDLIVEEESHKSCPCFHIGSIVCGCCIFGPFIPISFIVGAFAGGSVFHGMLELLFVLINASLLFAVFKMVKRICKNCNTNEKIQITEITQDEYNSFQIKNGITMNKYSNASNSVHIELTETQTQGE